MTISEARFIRLRSLVSARAYGCSHCAHSVYSRKLTKLVQER